MFSSTQLPVKAVLNHLTVLVSNCFRNHIVEKDLHHQQVLDYKLYNDQKRDASMDATFNSIRLLLFNLEARQRVSLNCGGKTNPYAILK